MEGLLQYLRVVNEKDDADLEPIRAHYGLADEIKKAEELKKQAAIDEDYENAAKYKKLILSLKDQTMTVERLRSEFIDDVPSLSIKQMLEMMNECDAGCTKTFVQNNARTIADTTKQNRLKMVNQLILMQDMKASSKGLEKVKTNFEDTLQVIHEQVRSTENAQKTMAYDLDQLDEEELAQFVEHKKIKTFLLGIQAMLVALTLMIESLKVAEQLDSQFQIDFEAIHNEASQLKRKLLGLNDQINNLLGITDAELICQ